MNPIGQLLAGRAWARGIPAVRGLAHHSSVSPLFTSFLVQPLCDPAPSFAPSLYNICFTRQFSDTSIVRTAVTATVTATTTNLLSSSLSVGRIARDGFVAARDL
ncbi:hypothetical protein LY78DRAFT_657226 [Colletotrichum sublineola]|nr:hypothetical protein LY78DRAFT_657226 [Colletotrichum sublineola]